MGTLRFLLEKEFRQFIRNPFLPKMTIFFPVLVMLIMPWVTTMDIRHIDVAVIDHDHSPASRRLVSKIGASDYFTLSEVADSYDDALETLEHGGVDVILEIPRYFERDIASGSPSPVSISANGVNAMKGGMGSQYLQQVVMQTLAELSGDRGFDANAEMVSVQNRYNPTLNYRNFMIPALMIMLIIMLCGFLPALNIVSEKEIGTIEQINVTPVSRFTFTLAKLIPYWIIGLSVLAVAMVLAWTVYGLTPVGSIGTIFLAAVLFILTMSGMGVVIANYSSTMQQTMFVMFFFIMIFVLMSGLMTPISSMPAWARNITFIFPPRYFIDIMRSVYLKGTHLVELHFDYAALALFAAGFNLWAALSYRKRM